MTNGSSFFHLKSASLVAKAKKSLLLKNTILYYIIFHEKNFVDFNIAASCGEYLRLIAKTKD
jgi:hypothetical protein